MKVLKNKIIVYLLVLSFSFMSIFNFSVSSYCDSVTVGANQYYWEHLNEFFAEVVGIIFNGSSDGPSQHSLTSHYSEKLKENNDDRSVDEFINDNVTINGDNIEVGRDLYLYMNDYANDYIKKSNLVPIYSYDVAANFSNFSDGQYYNALRQFITSHGDYYVFGANWYLSTYNILILPRNSTKFVLHAYNKSWGAYQSDPFNSINWFKSNILSQSNQVKNLNGEVYKYNTDNHQFEISNTGFYGDVVMLKDSPNGKVGNNCCFWLTYGSIETEYLFNNIDFAKGDTLGVKPYYITDKYNSDNSTISGSYNTTTSAIDNSISYGDVNNYINNYYNDPNNYDTNNQPQYPSTNDIYIYINNYQPEPSNPSGGGSSGGGNSGDNDSGDSSWNWGWLGKVGEFLGGLISAIGEIIAGLLDGILSIFTALTQDLPTLFNDLLGGLLSWLPPEITALITLSITFAVIVFVIRIIRG